jgi:tRNA pseudouridine13 synthase
MEPKPDPPPSGPVNLPHEVPFEHLDLPALGGHIGPEPEDFVVDELPLYEASGQGEHWYVRVRKRNATTDALRAAVAEAAGVPERELGHAGMKDKHAVTSQWLSVPGRASPPPTWRLPEAFSLLGVSRHSNKLRVGHLSGNRFSIHLVGVEPAARERLAPLAERLEKSGIGNFFGSQRFGIGQRNLDSALFALRRGRLGPRFGNRGKFMASVIQSEIFNRYVVARLAFGRDRLLPGEVVRLTGSRAVFIVEDAEKEQPRLDSGDIHLTGPLVGPKMKESVGQPHELEQASVAALGLDTAALAALGRAAPGTRRDLLLHPEDLSYAWREDGSVDVAFTLPAGAYASLVVRALTRQNPWGDVASREEVRSDDF